MIQFKKHFSNLFFNNPLPKVIIYYLSNDTFFITQFKKKFSLEYPYQFIGFSHVEELHNSVSLLRLSKIEIPFIIIDNTFSKNTIEPIANIEIANSILEKCSQTHIIMFDTENCIDIATDSHIFPILRNDNSYKRVEQIIFSVCNDFLLIGQKKSNKIIFPLITAIIIATSLFLIIYTLLFL